MFQQVAITTLALLGSCYGSTGAPGSDIQTEVKYDLVASGPNGGRLYNIIAESTYGKIPQLLNLTGSAYEQGFDTGFMTGEQFVENYEYLVEYLLGEDYPAIAGKVFDAFLDFQWTYYLGAQVPSYYIDEISGLADGGWKAGVKGDCGLIASRITVVANFPGDLSNLILVFQDEMAHPPTLEKFEKEAGTTLPHVLSVLESVRQKWKGLTCSMFGVWGARTDNQNVYTGRNLDWLAAIGISEHKMVTVFHPKDGIAHATVGWSGIWGAITGMSAAGLSVHEANLESDDITFRGFPWTLRLREVMAKATSIDEALQLWNATNNTVGFNHGVGSASDRSAVCMETMAGHTAVFSANDPREQNLVVDGEHVGSPREEAVYRTNHGYDQYTVEHYLDSYGYTVTRYMLFPEMIDMYADAGVAISYAEAVNISAVVGDKGDEHLYDCQTSIEEAGNILSVTFDLGRLALYAAWEDGYGEEFVPAACNTYLKLDMSVWFGK